jgi:SPP1 gp7 family putative phage head morphogenesis protein
VINRFDIKSMLKHLKRKVSVTLRPIETTVTLEKELRRIILKVVDAWSREINAILLPMYVVSSDQMTRDAPSDNVRVALDAIDSIINRLVVSLGIDIADWSVRVEEWHRDKFAMILKSALGLDLSSQMSEEDVRDEVQLAVERNVALVKGLSDDLKKNVEQLTFNAMIQQKPRKELGKELAKRLDVSRSRANFIARDQTTKLATDLDQMRQEQAGIKEYKWRHSGKAHPRPEHVARDGKIFQWAKPPWDGHPGQAPNCGCKAMAYVGMD